MRKAVPQTDWFGPLGERTANALLDELADRLGDAKSKLRQSLLNEFTDGTGAGSTGYEILMHAEWILESWQEMASEVDAMDAAREKREGA